MGMNTGHSRKKQTTGPVFWAVLGVVCLGTVLGVWLTGSDNQPSGVFGRAGAVALLALGLPAIVVASVGRGASLGFRRIFGVLTIALALCIEIIALGYFNASRGSADIAFGSILTFGVAAMLAAAIGLIRGRPA